MKKLIKHLFAISLFSIGLFIPSISAGKSNIGKSNIIQSSSIQVGSFSVCPDKFPDKKMPPPSSNIILCNSFFATVYDSTHNVAVYSVEKYQAQVSTYRTNNFHSDTRVPYIDTKVYLHSGFDKGHLVPANDAINSNQETETFSMSNIAPQLPSFNRKSWRGLEENVSHTNYRYILTGIILSDNKLGDISIPSYFYKVVYYDNSVSVFLGENVKDAQIKTVSLDELQSMVNYTIPKLVR